MDLGILGIRWWFQISNKGARHEERDVKISGVIRCFQAPKVFARATENPVHTWVSHTVHRVEPEGRARILCCNPGHHTLPDAWDDMEEAK